MDEETITNEQAPEAPEVCDAADVEGESAASEDAPIAETSDIGNDPDSVLHAVAELLGIELSSEDTEGELIECLQSRKLRSVICGCIRERNAEREYSNLLREAEALSSEENGFDLSSALSDKRLMAMVHAGLPLKDAFDAIHLEERIADAATAAREEGEREALKKLSELSLRPDENGGIGASPVKGGSDVERLTGKGIRDILRRVEKGAKIKF